MNKRFDDLEKGIQTKKKIRKLIMNASICGCLMVTAVFGLSYVKEGLIAAAAESKSAAVRDTVVDEKTHKINFEAAKKLGCSAKSWIYIPDAGIDYPLMQADDNDFYVDHDSHGEPSSSGAIFINFANSSDMSDGKTVIFGHNMLDDSMFANLKNYAKQEWGKRHPDAYIFLDNGKARHYRVRYYIRTGPTDEHIYVTSKAEDPSVTSDLLKAEAGVIYEEYTGGRLICLSTCSHHTERTVVVFEEIDDKYPLVMRDSSYYEEAAAVYEEEADVSLEDTSVEENEELGTVEQDDEDMEDAEDLEDVSEETDMEEEKPSVSDVSDEEVGASDLESTDDALSDKEPDSGQSEIDE